MKRYYCEPTLRRGDQCGVSFLKDVHFTKPRQSSLVQQTPSKSITGDFDGYKPLKRRSQANVVMGKQALRLSHRRFCRCQDMFPHFGSHHNPAISSTMDLQRRIFCIADDTRAFLERAPHHIPSNFPPSCLASGTCLPLDPQRRQRSTSLNILKETAWNFK